MSVTPKLIRSEMQHIMLQGKKKIGEFLCNETFRGQTKNGKVVRVKNSLNLFSTKKKELFKILSSPISVQVRGK